MEDLVLRLAQLSAAQQEANVLQRETNAQQAAQQEALAAQQAAQQEAQQEIVRLLSAQVTALAEAAERDRNVQAEAARKDRETLAEVLQQLNLRQEQAGSATGNSGLVKASHFLQKMTPHDDVEAFLNTFERTAEREAWPKTQWAGLVAPFLTGDSQKAYFDLTAEDAQDYEKLKLEILRRLGVTPAVRAQRVHRWNYLSNKSPRSQMHDLIYLVRKWLQPEILTAPQIVERVTMDRFLTALPHELRKWVSHADPKSADELVEMVERYLAAEGFLAGVSAPENLPAKRRLPAGPGRGTSALSSPGGSKTWVKTNMDTRCSKDTLPGSSIQCWRCKAWGHVAAKCPMVTEPMECEAARRLSFFAHPACLTSAVAHMALVKVGGRSVQALLDSGSLVTLVHSDLVAPDQMKKQCIGVLCIHGDAKSYGTAVVPIETQFGVTPHEVGVSKSLMHSVILGRDFPLFWELWKVEFPPQTPLTLGDECSASLPEIGDSSSEVSAVRVAPLEPDQFPLSVLVGDTEASQETVEESPMPELEYSQDNFGTSQLRDPTLAHAWENVAVINGVAQGTGLENVYPQFVVNHNLLYRVDNIRGEMVEQLVVPSSHRKIVLDLAHKNPMGGHLAAEKTQQRVLQRFFWPGVFAEIKRYCGSCPECQLTSPAPHFRGPLVPLPIIEVPFHRIAMDLVGPLVKSAKGHQYILVVLDYATRYPEAIPLRNTSAKTIARELFHMFARTGIPKEILTDQGTPFMSRVMKDLCKLLGIQQLRTSVYHPQTDGLVERFNKTLKSMLKRVVDADGRDWDCLLPYLMFAVREVPQSSTGFSPFELLYGRHPRGLLDIAKESWEEEPSPHRSVVEHVLQMQDRITAVMPIVQEHMRQAQEAQSRIYNRGARLRVFEPGDRVLVLVPTAESKFLAKWQGPYEIVEKMGDVNYKVHQPDKRKKIQIYHVNLIKAWKDPLVSMAAERLSPSLQGGVPEVRVSGALSRPQAQEVKEFLLRNADVFSDLPGCTHVIEHDIVTDPQARVRLKPYRIPEARRQAVAGEIQRMLELGVIEPSHSEWSSPIVLVPKPDGSLRFCNDFRKLNEVSKFDTYPMPRVDELIERLGPARYITTLDLTRGYWQIPLTPTAREKTAFSSPQGLFHYVRMPFGLHGAPATFQRLMDEVLRPHQHFASVYLDDVVIFSSDWESHLPKVQAVINSIRQAGLTANPKKCALGLEEARYLGYIIGKGLIRPQVQKVHAIKEWPQPCTKKQVRTFLGMVGYYQRFVPDFATIAAPLTNLIKGKSSGGITWNKDAEVAFCKLKEVLCSGPVLIAPDFKKKFVVQTDASNVGLGAVLSQMVHGEEHPVVYLSRKLTPAEKNYSIVERECLAIKWALEALRYYLLGRRFRLVTDHSPLTWMAQAKGQNARVTRWFLSLQDYNFSVEHRAGKLQANADALSRTYCMFMESVRTHGFEQRGEVCDRVSQCLSEKVLDGVYVAPRFQHFMC
ncbi:uncharacterized protein [Hyperolius riggenbachi]|uniref:uncharacterized protein n=2 Tax=Hyperolius riggenbachi TaxID=752182 RepID=UPI0035A39CC4